MTRRIALALIAFAVTVVALTIIDSSSSAEVAALTARKASPVVLVQQVGHNNQYAVVLKSGRTWVVPACKYEDSANCWWDAGVAGNKKGRSFADLNGRVHYVSKNASVFRN